MIDNVKPDKGVFALNMHSDVKQIMLSFVL